VSPLLKESEEFTPTNRTDFDLQRCESRGVESTIRHEFGIRLLEPDRSRSAFECHRFKGYDRGSANLQSEGSRQSWFSDNITAVVHVCTETRRHSFFDSVQEECSSVFSAGMHLEGETSNKVDARQVLNRGRCTQQAEWSLQEVVCRRLFKLFSEVRIDLLAKFANKSLPVFVGPCPYHRAMAMYTFSMSWEDLMAYAFSPVRQLNPVLQGRGFN